MCKPVMIVFFYNLYGFNAINKHPNPFYITDDS